jgi:hypothetical protein
MRCVTSFFNLGREESIRLLRKDIRLAYNILDWPIPLATVFAQYQSNLSVMPSSLSTDGSVLALKLDDSSIFTMDGVESAHNYNQYCMLQGPDGGEPQLTITYVDGDADYSVSAGFDASALLSR